MALMVLYALGGVDQRFWFPSDSTELQKVEVPRGELEDLEIENGGESDASEVLSITIGNTKVGK